MSLNLTEILIIPVDRLRVTWTGDILHRQIESSKISLNGKPIQAMQYISPFSYHLQNHATHAVLILMAAFQICGFINVISIMPSYGEQSLRKLRLIAEPARSGSLSLLHKGCEIASLSFNRTDTTMIYSFPVIFDGFFISFNDSSNGGQRQSLIMKGYSDNWETSAIVGSLNVRWTASGVRFLKSPVYSGTTVLLNFRPPWPWVLHTLLSEVGWALLCLTLALLGFFRRLMLGQVICFGLFCLLALGSAVSSIGFEVLGREREAFLPFTDFIFYAALATALHAVEMVFFDAVVFLACALLACNAAGDCLIFDDCANLLDNPPVRTIIVMTSGLYVVILRHRFLAKATAGIEADQAAFDSAWRDLVARSRGELSRLEAATQRMAAHCATLHARQLNRRLTASGDSRQLSLERVHPFHSESCMESADNASSLAGTVDLRKPVASLDQLYAQALGVAPVLRWHCAEWARLTGGALDDSDLSNTAGVCGHRLGDAPDSAGARSNVGSAEWWALQPGIKPPAQAVRKAVTCYGGDVSRLLDVCRCRIAFEGAEGILRCLEAMRARSPAVKVIRIKNSLSPFHDPRHTAGYRVFSVSLGLLRVMVS